MPMPCQTTVDRLWGDEDTGRCKEAAYTGQLPLGLSPLVSKGMAKDCGLSLPPPSGAGGGGIASLRRWQMDLINEGTEPWGDFGLTALPTFTPLLKRQKTLDEMSGVEKPPTCNWVVPNNVLYPSYSALKHLASEVQSGLRAGFSPALAEMSVGGAYFMRNRLGRIAGVFKPLDEEPYAANNPRDFRGSGLGMKNGIPAGEAGIREAAVFIIDAGFSGVAPTVMVKVQCRRFKDVENKEGSLQQYVRHIGTSDDYGPSKFNTEDAHRIMLLDIRTCNQDRHAGNILVSDGINGCFSDMPEPRCASDETPLPLMPSGPLELRRSHSVGPSLEVVRPQRRRTTPRRTDLDGLRLIPIDHGFALPHPFACDETEFCWMFWPQAKRPLSAELKEYVANLDVEEDIARVKAALGDAVPAHCFLTLRIGTTLLKLGVARGLSLYEIGHLIVRDNMDKPSRLEVAIEEARAEMLADDEALKAAVAAAAAAAVNGGGSAHAHGAQHARTPLPSPLSSPRRSSSCSSMSSGAVAANEKEHKRFMSYLEPALVSLVEIVMGHKFHRSQSV